ncbi:MAG: hypothetical protein QG615_1286, partial [Nitrospirota bacterium]|nr:hypothetical protein [Nitrospirota bacterium]
CGLCRGMGDETVEVSIAEGGRLKSNEAVGAIMGQKETGPLS